MSRLFDRVGSGFYATAKGIATAAGLERSAWGRKGLARLNVVGEKFGRLFLLRDRTFKIDGHLLHLAGRSGPSVSFSTELLSARYEQETTTILKETLCPGMNVLDVGAHVGSHALLAARLVGPLGKVFAFEPSPDNFALLQKNVALNGYQNIVTIAKAVSDKTGVAMLHLSPEGNDRNALQRLRSAPPGKSVEVPTISLDDFLEEIGWPPIRLIKMDVEGAEPLVLKGMSRLLERCGDIRLIAEFAPACIRDGAYTPVNFLEALAGCGFRIHVLQTDGAPKPLAPSEFANFTREVEIEGMRNLLCHR